MKAAIVHTDFRIYWPARLRALEEFLKEKEIHLDIIEISGVGSQYSFAEKNANIDINWHILFPDTKIENIKNNDIKDRLYAILNSIQPDIIIAGAIAFPSGALSVSWASTSKKKVIIFDDAKIDTVPRNKFINYIKQNIYNGVYAMLYPSEDWVSTGEFWGFRREQLFYGIDVVDNAFWQNQTALQTSTARKYFLAIGRQIPQKNFFHIVKEYKRYNDRFQNESYPLLLVGDGPEHAQIQQYVADNNLSTFVSFLPFKNQSELREIYYNAEVLILSSKSETWGLVINEGMACGLPIIASDQCGATNTLVKNNINGYSFSLSDKNSLFEKLCLFHSLSDIQKNEMRKASLEIIKEWDLDKFCKNCYNAIIYTSNLPVKKLSIINKLIIKLWKGRYRPV